MKDFEDLLDAPQNVLEFLPLILCVWCTFSPHPGAIFDFMHNPGIVEYDEREGWVLIDAPLWILHHCLLMCVWFTWTFH